MSLTAGSGTSGEAWRRRYVGWGAVGVLAPLSWVNPLLGEPGFENSRVRLSRAGSIGRRCAKERSFLGLQASPAEAWSARAAVNRSFSEALRGDERKSSAAAFGSNSMRLFRIIIPLTAPRFSRVSLWGELASFYG